MSATMDSSSHTSSSRGGGITGGCSHGWGPAH